MSISRQVLVLNIDYSKQFISEFDFYLDSIDRIHNINSLIGPDDLSILSEQEQNLIKTYLFLVESSNTTSAGALLLFSGNYYSDSYSLLRVLYEIASLMYYGNKSKENSIELYKTIFKSNLSESNHIKQEWSLTKKATSCFEDEVPKLKEIHKELNDFGSHISLKKVVLGNVTSINNSSVSSVFIKNFHQPRFLAGLDLLHGLMMKITEEYHAFNLPYTSNSKEVDLQIESVNNLFINEIRPKLQAKMK